MSRQKQVFGRYYEVGVDDRRVKMSVNDTTAVLCTQLRRPLQSLDVAEIYQATALSLGVNHLVTLNIEGYFVEKLNFLQRNNIKTQMRFGSTRN